MNLAIRAREIIRGISPTLSDELDQVIARINFVWSKEHNPQDGTHKNLRFRSSGDGRIQTQSTVGAAGPASALPATPTTYLVVTVDGTDYVQPLYPKS